MLHKYLSHERDEDGLNFFFRFLFFEKNRITQAAGQESRKAGYRKQVDHDKGFVCS